MFERMLKKIFATHDDDYVYMLPFRVGEVYLVCQGYGGKTHVGESLYSIDFKMPIGTHICASREGVVHYVVDHYGNGGADDQYADKCNTIMIEHDDGSIAVYAHLDRDGAKVHEKQRIEKGQFIGISGSSGYSAYPHLHFHVVTKSGRVPTWFQVGPDLTKSRLMAGAYYKRYK